MFSRMLANRVIRNLVSNCKVQNRTLMSLTSKYSNLPVYNSFNRRFSLVATDSAEAVSTSENSENLYAIDSFGLDQSLVDTLHNQFKITNLFPIQAKVMTPIQQGQDVIGKSKTGTGKTLAFLLPLIDNIVKAGYPQPESNSATVLIMEPTRELANQVARELEKLDPRIRTCTIYGGSPYDPQIRALTRGVHVIVATPGRLIDHVNSGALRLDGIKHVILDEADEMLRVGFADVIETIMQGVGENRQTILFSATVPKWIAGLAMKYTKNYAFIDCAVTQSGDATPTLITHKACMLPRDSRSVPAVLISLIKSYSKNGRCIIFSETKAFASELENLLNHAMSQINPRFRGQYAAALHGDISQSSRENILNKFRENRLNVLVATDVAARGIDIPGVDLVLQLGIPREIESYVHRSGRTGRAGKEGTCVLLYKHEQRCEMASLSAATGVRFSQVLADDLQEDDINIAIQPTKKAINNSLSTINTKLQPILDGEENTLALTSAAHTITSDLMEKYQGNEVELITALVETIMSTHLTGSFNSRFSILSSNVGYTTVKTSQNATVPMIIRQLTSALNIESSSVTIKDLTPTSQGVFFDIPEEICNILAQNLEALPDFEIPQRLAPELFQRQASYGGASRGGYGGGSGRGGYGGGANRSGDRYGNANNFGGSRDRGFSDRGFNSNRGGNGGNFGGNRGGDRNGDRGFNRGGDRGGNFNRGGDRGNFNRGGDRGGFNRDDAW